MKGKLVLTAILLMYIAAVNATVYTWPYDFGTGTGSFATSNTSSTTFMPQPSAVPVSGGEDYVYCSNVGGGGLFLENPGLPTIGSATELRLQASTNASPNKFSIYNNTNKLDDQSSYHSFSIQFGNAAGGNVTTAGGAFYFFVGKGVMYTSDAAYANAQIFTGIRWVLGATGTITATYSTNSGWNALAGITFVQGRKYDIAVYANNKASGNTYTRNGTGYSLSNNKWDLWVDNVRIAAALANTQLGGSVFLDSFLFSGDTATGNNACAFIDDIIYMNSCTGTVTIDPTEYYATPTGNLNLTTSWVTNVDGIGGSNPPNFTSGYQTFYIQNNAAPTIGANWVVSGTSTNVILGDGTNAVTFTIPSAFTMTGPINVQNNGTLKLENTTYPTIGTLATGSTVEYAATGAQSVPVLFYSNLRVSGTGTKTLAGTTTVGGNLNISATTDILALGANTLNVTGAVSGSGLINYNGTGRVGGTGSFAAANFSITQIGTNTITMPAIINNLGVNTLGAVTMGGNTSVNNLALTTGMSIGATILTINGAISGSGILTGGATSNVIMAGTSASTTLPAVTLNNLTINRASGISMGGNVTVGGVLALTSGALGIGADTLTINGSTSGTSGLVGGSTSSITIGGTGNLVLPSVSSLHTLNITRANVIDLSSTMTISNNFNLATGTVVNSSSANTLTFASGATGTGSGTVNGPVRQNTTAISASGDFSNMYMGLSIRAGTSAVSPFSALKTDVSNSVNNGISIAKTWHLSGASTTSNDITFSWPTAADNGNDFAGGVGTVWRFDGSVWVRVYTGTITTTSGIRSVNFAYNFGAGGSAGDFTVRAASPVISTSVPSLTNFGLIKIGSSSTPLSYTVSGTELIANLSIIAPAGFEISTSSSSGYGSLITLIQTNGFVNSTPILCTLHPQLSGTPDHKHRPFQPRRRRGKCISQRYRDQ